MSDYDSLLKRIEVLEYKLHPEWFVNLYDYKTTCEYCGKPTIVINASEVIYDTTCSRCGCDKHRVEKYI